MGVGVETMKMARIAGMEAAEQRQTGTADTGMCDPAFEITIRTAEDLQAELLDQIVDHDRIFGCHINHLIV